MTGTQLAAMIRYKTGTNSTTFTDANMLVLVNTFKDEISSLIVQRSPSHFLLPATFDLAADQREYAFDDNQLNSMHKLELKFAASDSRFPATFIKDYQDSETESEIVKNFSNSQGGFAFTIRRRAVFILSGTIITVTAGGRLWYHLYPADLANLTGSTDLAIDPTTTTFGFPRQFHELLARRVAIEYKGSRPKPIPLNATEKNYEIDLEKQLAAISSPSDSGEIIGELPSAQEMGNNGFDY